LVTVVGTNMAQQPQTPWQRRLALAQRCPENIDKPVSPLECVQRYMNNEKFQFNCLCRAPDGCPCICHREPTNGFMILPMTRSYTFLYEYYLVFLRYFYTEKEREAIVAAFPPDKRDIILGYLNN